MFDPKVSVRVFRYDTEVKPPIWNYNGFVEFELVERNHEHPHCIKITTPGGFAVVPFHEFVKAAEWLKRCEP